MRNDWPPKFASHEDWDPDFPGCGYPKNAKHTLIGETLDFDTQPEVKKSRATLGPRVYHIPTLLESCKSGKHQAGDTTLPTPSTSSQVAKPQSFRSLPVSSHLAKPSKPSVGGFKAQMRVNNSVSLEEKRSSADAQHSRKGKPKPDPQAQINSVLAKLEELKDKVEQFTGTSNAEKDYRYLEEMLMRLMLKLDDVETDDHPGLRQERKKAVKDVQSCISLLESRLAQNQANVIDGTQPHSI